MSPAVPTTVALSVLAETVRQGLSATPKRLPPWLFYDAEGSRLFEAITELPEYYPTRTERDILQAHAAEVIMAAADGADGDLSLVELGAGTATKTRLLIEALLARQGRAVYAPIDVSVSALGIAQAELEARYPSLEVRPLAMTYEEGFLRLPGIPGRRLVLFLGSSVGNFDPPAAAAFLDRLRASLAPGDALLLGTDLAKDPAVLVPAYDDAQGVTAAFNLNLLARLNRELEADFDLAAFRHLALWNEAASRIEMHLVSTRAQRALLRALDLEFAFGAGERLHTENSYKFTPAMTAEVLRGYHLERSWTDGRAWFALHLARVL
ncbi:MAG TPA: L-histidine N(alpha)-methyltransferase [Holophagaceae bacterium]|nr:L-histidine N(alpha)-methyltransferase [Holophagaceae bacterium]